MSALTDTKATTSGYNFASGVYATLPVYFHQQLSVDISLGYHQGFAAGTVEVQNGVNWWDADIKFFNSDVVLDVMPRWEWFRGRVVPYTAVGISSRINTNHSSEIFVASLVNSNIVQFNTINNYFTYPGYFAGFSAEQGVRIDAFSRSYIEPAIGYSRFSQFAGDGFVYEALYFNVRLNLWLW